MITTMKMSPVEAFREFINVRLTAAAGEIYTEFQQTIGKCRPQIDSQRRLLDISQKRPKNPATADERDFYIDQQVWNMQNSSSLGQNEPEPPQIEEDSARLEVKREADIIMVTVIDEMGEHGDNVDCHNPVRGFINRRLTAAAGEIFTECQQSIVQYQEIDARHKLLDVSLKPQIQPDRTDVPEHRVCKEEQLWNQEMNSSLDEEPKPPQIKEEQEELGTSQEGEKLVLEQKVSHFIVIPPSEPNPGGALLLPQNYVLVKNQQVNSGLRRIAPLDPNSRRHNDNVDNSSPRQRSFSFHKKSGGKAFICQTCGRSFRKPGRLSEHLRSHSGEKPFSCETCNRTFRHRSSFSRHKRSHSEIYACKTYDKTFVKPYDLVVHISSHTGEKPYSCGACEKTFSSWNSMTGHMKCHTGVNMYPCETCGRSFRHLSSLSRHKRSHV